MEIIDFTNGPTEIRTRVSAVRGQRPWPLDDGASSFQLFRGRDSNPGFYGPEPHVLPVGQPRSDRLKKMLAIEAQDAKKPTTILQEVGYNEVVGVRRVGKSTACLGCLFSTIRALFLLASLFRSTVVGGCCQLEGVPIPTWPKCP